MRNNFLIVGTQRTGSQALYRGFNLHPDVYCGGEWVQHVPWYHKIKATERALSGDFRDVLLHRPRDGKRISDSLTSDKRWLGFKILFRSSDKWLLHPRYAPALVFDRLEGHIKWMRRRSEVHVVHLVRRNMVEWLKSKYLAGASGMFTQKQYPDKLKVTIPIHRAMRAAATKQWVDSRLSTLATSNPYHLVYYEDFLANNRRALESCLELLDCDLSRLPDDTKFIQRQSKGTASDYIQNHDELVAALDKRHLLSSPV